METTIKLALRDNCFGEQGELVAAQISPQDAAALPDVLRLLARFANRPLHEWESLGLTVHGAQAKGLAEADDGALADLPAYTLSHAAEATLASINTYNCMGVVRLRDRERRVAVQLEIGSRFNSGPRQHFLTYLLSKTFGGSLTESVELGGSSFWEMLLAFVLRHRLLAACQIGLFKEYRRVEGNDLRFRGQMNLDAHLRHNVPFRGRLAYTTHEISFDNPINHLLRHAIAKVLRKWPGVLGDADGFSELRHQLEQGTPSWRQGHLLSCLQQNVRPVRHPFFHGCYEPLRRIALALLRSEGAGLFDSTHEAEGVLFDGSWLWESYLWTLLKPLGFQHPDNRRRTGGWPVLHTSFYPDFFLGSAEPARPRVVLDAKYKRDSRALDDIRQVLAYMYLLGASDGGLIKPEGAGGAAQALSSPCGSEERGRWHDLAVAVPQDVSCPRAFRGAMRASERALIDALKPWTRP